MLSRLIVVLFLLALTASPASAQSAGDPNLYGPKFKYCGSFKASYRIHVYAKKITCRKARSIQRELWLGPRSRKVYVNGGAGADGYVKLKRFRGWKCSSGSGGGSCSKRSSSAAYAN